MDYERLIQRSVDLIEGRLFDKISIDELAADAFFSKHHYQRMFHGIVGDPIMEYVKKRRLSLAGREICESDDSILEIALKYGYGSHEAFTRAFKNYHGITPVECRKYKLFHFFEKKYLFREDCIMSNLSNTIDFGSILSESAVTKLSSNTHEIMEMINEFATSAKKTGESVADRTKDKPYYSSFEVLSKETLFLSERVRSVCEIVKEFLGDEKNKFNSDRFFNAFDNNYKIIKALDDITFQTHIITLYVGLEASRTSADECAEIFNEYKNLAQGLTVDKEKMVTLINELIGFISIDIFKEATNQVKAVIGYIRDTIDKVDSVGRLTGDEALRAGSPGDIFNVFANEIKNIYNDGHDLINQISGYITEAENFTSIQSYKQWLEKINYIPYYIEDRVFRLNILAFSAELEIAKVPEIKGLASATKQIVHLLVDMNGLSRVCAERLDEAKKLISLFESGDKISKSPSACKILDDIAFQGNILALNLTVEAARYRRIDQANGDGDLSAMAMRVIASISDIHAMRTKLDLSYDSSKDIINDDIHNLIQKLQSVVDGIRNHSAFTSKNGKPFIYLIDELEKYINRIRNFS